MENNSIDNVLEKRRTAAKQYIQCNYIPLFSANVDIALESCTSTKDINEYFSLLERICEMVKYPQQRSADFIELIKPHSRGHLIQYADEYLTVGHMLVDLRRQSLARVRETAVTLRIGPNTLKNLEMNTPPQGKRSIKYFERQGGQIKERMIAYFSIPEKEHKRLMALPFYNEDLGSPPPWSKERNY